jgi:hypothetical protein
MTVERDLGFVDTSDETLVVLKPRRPDPLMVPRWFPIRPGFPKGDFAFRAGIAWFDARGYPLRISRFPKSPMDFRNKNGSICLC